ncbi:MAG: hypothetical protein EOP08_02630 [Proteobacteria bacterium]|nr:MAG: hypothetical protein EOP08_02630 [Pseudomonadota bacterium]
MQVRFVAYDAAGNVRAMREARASVPSTGTRLLRLPLLWINDGLVETAGGPLVASSGVQLADVGLQDVTEDVFTRLSDGCPADHTRGDDGLCQSIDVRFEDLEDLGGKAVAPIPACMDLVACFRGTQVETFALGLRSGCELPIQATASTEKPALMLVGPNTGGFPVAGRTGADDAALTGRPIDDALYDYDVERHVVRFGPALCAKIERDGITTAIVSAKCAPKDTDAPICGALKQVSTGPRPTNAGVFVGEDGPSDAGPETSTDADADGPDSTLPPPPSPIDFTAPVSMDGIYSFTARGGSESKLWMAGYVYDQDNGFDTLQVRVAPWLTPATQTTVVPSAGFDVSARGKLVVDRQGEAFFVQPYAGGEEGSHRSLGFGEPGTAGAALRYCPTGGCASDADASACSSDLVRIAIGDQNGETVLLDARENGLGSVTVRAVVRRGPIGCFEPRLVGGVAQTFDTPAPYPDTLFPAVSVGGDLVASLRLGGSVPPPDLLVRATNAELGGTTLPPLEQFGHLAVLGGGRLLASSPVPGDEREAYTRFTVLEAGAARPDPLVQTLVPVNQVDEMFGLDNVGCVRGIDAKQQWRIACATRSAAGTLTPVMLHLSALYSTGYRSEFDPHLYSDERYLYVGQFCSRSRTVEVRGVAWQYLQDPAALQEAFFGMCGGDFLLTPS